MKLRPVCRSPLTFALLNPEIQPFLQNKWDPLFQCGCAMFCWAQSGSWDARTEIETFTAALTCIFELFNICINNFGGKKNFSFCQFCKSTAEPLIAVIMKIRTCLRIN